MKWLKNMTCLNALEGKNWKSDQKIAMDEELVQNSVINEHFVKNSVMNAQIDPKIVMGLSILKIGCWKNLLMRMNRGC